MKMKLLISSAVVALNFAIFQQTQAMERDDPDDITRERLKRDSDRTMIHMAYEDSDLNGYLSSLRYGVILVAEGYNYVAPIAKAVLKYQRRPMTLSETIKYNIGFGMPKDISDNIEMCEQIEKGEKFVKTIGPWI